MAFNLTQEVLFLGAPTRSFNTSLGFNSSPSTLNIVVVDDPVKGNLVQIPSIGSYFDFDFGSLHMGGIITSYRTADTTAGKEEFQVTVTDPREIMRSSILITSPGAKDIESQLRANGVLNVLDVFSEFNEGFGFTFFNTSGWNATGMPSDSIEDAINNNVFVTFGETYRFVLNLPNVNSKNRINNRTVSISSFIQQMAELGGYDWYVESNKVGSEIRVDIKIIDRQTNNTELSLDDFVTSLTGRVNSLTQGSELRNDIASVSLQGAPIEFLFEQNVNTGIVEEGQTINVNDDNFQNFTIDLGQVVDDWPNRYVPDYEEMRYALTSFDGWLFYINSFGLTKAPWKNEPNLSGDFLPGNLTGTALLRDNIGNPNTKSKFRLSSTITKNDNGIATPSPLIQTLNIYDLLKAAYPFIKTYAEEHYGKTFIYDKTNLTEINSAWTADGPFSGKGKKNANKFFYESFGKTSAYCEYSYDGLNPDTADLSDLNFEDYVWGTDVFTSDSVIPASSNFLGNAPNSVPSGINNTRVSLFVRCTVTNGILKTPGKVRFRNFAVTLVDDEGFKEAIQTIIEKSPSTEWEGTGIGSGIRPQAYSQVLKQDIKSIILAGVNFIKDNVALKVSNVFVPVQSETTRWGPFFSDLAGQGIADIRTDDSYNPEEFQSFALMTAAAEEHVKNAGSVVVQLDSAEIEVEGIPEVNIGAAIGLNSNVTNVSVNFSTSKITTRYSLKSFEVVFGKERKINRDSIVKLDSEAFKKEKPPLFDKTFRRDKLKQLPVTSPNPDNTIDNGIHGRKILGQKPDGTIDTAITMPESERGNGSPGTQDGISAQVDE